MATQHTVVVFDNRGIATSQPAPVRGLTIAKMADDTAGLIDALGLGKADVLGWSMGGNIAEVLVQRHPDKVNRLILAATDPGGPQAVQPTDPLAVKLLTDTNPPISLLLKAIFPPTPAGRAASKAYVGRLGLWPDTGPDAFTTPSATVCRPGPRRGAAVVLQGLRRLPEAAARARPDPGHRRHARHPRAARELAHHRPPHPGRQAHALPGRRPRPPVPVQRALRGRGQRLPRRGLGVRNVQVDALPATVLWR